MKIKIKSREEIEKTLAAGSDHCSLAVIGDYIVSDILMAKEMIAFCEMESEVKEILEDGSVIAFNWYWHKDWYEVLEPEFTEEDLMDIELMNEMLAYFIEIK